MAWERSIRWRLGRIALAVCASAACGGGSGGPPDDDDADTGTPSTTASSSEPTATSVTTTESSDATSSTGAADSSTGDPEDPQELAPLCADGLPVAFDRPDVGDPIDPADLSAATQRYLDLLDGMRFFEVVDGRVHGWPQEDPEARYWYGTWWSGVTIVKDGDDYTFRHEDQGADNNGLRTGPLMEGLCYAHALWQRPEHELLVRRMMRGFSAWMRASERMVDDPDAPILTRAFYPESVTSMQAGHAVAIDYSLNRPGIDAAPSAYVHIAANPDWGDVWIKNKRSKDDIGHMLRAVVQVGACEPLFAEGTADFEEVRTRYSAWSRLVEDDGWSIRSLDADAQLWFPDDLLANFVAAECTSKLALRLLGRFDGGDLECGNGIGAFDAAIIAANDQNGNILRSFHEAAANAALLAGQDELAIALLDGLAVRISAGMDGFDGSGPEVPHLGENDLVGMMAHGAAVGVPLTSREVGWLHEQIQVAHDSYLDNADLQDLIGVFDEGTPDGEYGYEPYGAAINWVDLASLLGTCASPCVNPGARPVLDCAMVEAWSPD
jgi:hypothetical protein